MPQLDTPIRSTTDKLFGLSCFFFVFIFVFFAFMLVFADVMYIDLKAIIHVVTSPAIRDALWLSIWTSATTTALSLLFAIPMGYALSRYRFPGQILVDATIDLPIVFPPLVAGMTLLVFFSHTSLGKWIESIGLEFVFQPKGIVLCQFVVAASFAIRSCKTAFDEADRRLEYIALTLGCSQWRSFWRVSLPLAKRGVLSGGILTWARAFSIFGPLMIFVGSFRGRTEVLSTSIFLEQSIGNLEVALAIALLLLLVAAVALLAIRLLGGGAMVKI